MNIRHWQILCITLSLLLVCNTSQAQFWKKRSKRKKKKHKIEYPLPDNGKRLGLPDSGKKEIVKKLEEVSIYPETQQKDRYRIDLLMPLYLDELIVDGNATFKTRVPAKILQPILFYEGVKLAIDTLKKMGYKLDVYVHDVKADMMSTESLINTGTFDNSDLLIGVLPSRDFKPVAGFAKRNKVNLISALSPSDGGIEDNAYFTMLQPKLQTHCDAVKTHMFKKYQGRPITLLYRTKVPVDKMAYEYFAGEQDVLYKPLSCNEMPTYEQLKPFFSGNVSNVILMPIISDKYVSSLLKKIHEWFPEYQFDVWGMPSWNDMSSLRKSNAYPNIAVYFTTPFYFDPTTASGKALVNNYRKKYGVNPDDMVYRGYETMLWYAYLLNKYGNIFNRSMRDNGGAPFTRFDMITNRSEDGKLLYNENKNVYLYRYQSSSYMIQR